MYVLPLKIEGTPAEVSTYLPLWEDRKGRTSKPGLAEKEYNPSRAQRWACWPTAVPAGSKGYRTRLLQALIL